VKSFFSQLSAREFIVFEEAYIILEELGGEGTGSDLIFHPQVRSLARTLSATDLVMWYGEAILNLDREAIAESLRLHVV